MTASAVGLVLAVFSALLGLVFFVALVVSAVLARGPARVLAPIGFGLLTLSQLVVGLVIPALGGAGLVSVIVRLVILVPAIACLALAVVLGQRAAQRPAATQPPYGGQPSAVPQPPYGQQPLR